MRRRGAERGDSIVLYARENPLGLVDSFAPWAMTAPGQGTIFLKLTIHIPSPRSTAWTSVLPLPLSIDSAEALGFRSAAADAPPSSARRPSTGCGASGNRRRRVRA